MSYNPVKARARLLARYGLKPADFARILLDQDGTCAICRRPPSGRRMLDIDHDHATREVRGLLCFLCNKGLGYFRQIDATRLYQYLACGGSGIQGGTGYFVPKRKRRKR